MATRYVIRDTRLNRLIHAFNATHQVVEITDYAGYARIFPSKDAALRFIDRYADAGYGFYRKDAVIEEIK